MKKPSLYGLANILGGAILYLWLGCNFLWPNITIYVLSYFYDLYQSDLTMRHGEKWSRLKYEAMEHDFIESKVFVSLQFVL